MNNLYLKIKSLLDQNKIDYQELEHKPVFTSEQASAIRGLPESVGAKSLLLRLKTKEGDRYIMAIIPGNSRLDNRKIKQIYNARDVTFVKPEKVLELVGCEIGAVYPLGSICNIETIADPSIANNEKISFNPARHDHSMTIATKDWLELEKPRLEKISI